VIPAGELIEHVVDCRNGWDPFPVQSEMSINSLQKLVYYAKFYGKIASFNKLCLIFEQDVTGDLTTLTANSSKAFASERNRQRQFPIIIRRNSGWVPVNLKTIWEYRELLYFLAWRDIKVRYKQMFYPLFTFCALLPWQLFARALTDSSNSLVTNQNLLTKVYFPRLVVPLAAGLPALVDFAFALRRWLR
jgi:hypothetical protein